MSSSAQQVKLLAQALYDIRALLGGYLGSQSNADLPVRIAAHLSYALHNEALALLEGQAFDTDEALRKVSFVDRQFDEAFAQRYVEILNADRKEP